MARRILKMGRGRFLVELELSIKVIIGLISISNMDVPCRY